MDQAWAQAISTISGGIVMVLVAVAAYIQARAARISRQKEREEDRRRWEDERDGVTEEAEDE